MVAVNFSFDGLEFEESWSYLEFWQCIGIKLDTNKFEKVVDVVALGSAIVDLFCAVPESYIDELGMIKGSMQLVGPDLSEAVISQVGQADLSGGGSAANTLVGLSLLGHSVTVIASTDQDHFGEEYISDLQRVGVKVVHPVGDHGLGTGRCLVMVTPDGERTMATWLGAAGHLELDDESISSIVQAKVLYIEGYLYDLDSTKLQIIKAIDVAAESGSTVALSLSDPFCVERHRGEFLELLKGKVSLVFANKDEAQILTGTSDLENMVEFFRSYQVDGAVTLGANGAMIFNRTNEVLVPAVTVDSVVDTTGAGDLFAAGYLHGLLQVGPDDLKTLGAFGTKCASEVIGHYGARPESSLLQLLQTD